VIIVIIRDNVEPDQESAEERKKFNPIITNPFTITIQVKFHGSTQAQKRDGLSPVLDLT
jgi:hypothetical protein